MGWGGERGNGTDSDGRRDGQEEAILGNGRALICVTGTLGSAVMFDLSAAVKGLSRRDATCLGLGKRLGAST